MTAAVAVAGRTSAPRNAGLAAAAVAVTVLLVVGQEQVRRLEALGSAALLRLLNIAPADSIGTAVTFQAKDRFAGFTVAPGCTAALLIAPFFLAAGLLLLSGRVRPGRAVATVTVFAVVVALVNQMRFAVIAVSMRSWGYPAGFERSHVLLGSLVSTLGVAGGLLLFLRMVVPRREREQRSADG